MKRPANFFDKDGTYVGPEERGCLGAECPQYIEHGDKIDKIKTHVEGLPVLRKLIYIILAAVLGGPILLSAVFWTKLADVSEKQAVINTKQIEVYSRWEKLDIWKDGVESALDSLDDTISKHKH